MFSKDVRYQLLATVCCNIITVGYGAVCGWPSASIPVLQDPNETPLATGPLTMEQASWVNSLMCAGGFLGNWLFVWACDRFGPKISLIVTALFQLSSWILIIVASSPEYLYVGRLLAGISGGGAFVLVPMFVTEIADDRVRGVLGSLLVFSCNIGILLAFVLGNYFRYQVAPYVLCAIPLAFLGVFVFLPESPAYLVRNGRDEDATRSLRFYRNMKEDSVYENSALQGELAKLKAIYLSQEKLQLEVGVVGVGKASGSSISLRDFCNPIARRAMLIGVGLVSLNQFCGCFAMLNYTASIFREAGSDLTPNMAAIVIGVIQLAGAYMSTVLVDRAGRKFLLSFSALGTALGLVSLGVYSQLQELGWSMEGVGWLPVASFSFTIFIASWGVLTLPFLVIAEIMPEKIRALGTSVCISLLWAFAFIMVKWFTLLTQLLGMYGCMYLFTGCCVAGAVFVLGVLPETKGKSFDEIMALLAK